MVSAADGRPMRGAWGDRLPPGRYEGGKGRSVQGCGIQTGGWRAFLDEVSQDLEDLHGVGDHGDDLHGLVASRAAQRVHFIDLLDQASKCGRSSTRNSTAGKAFVSGMEIVGIGCATDHGVGASLVDEQILQRHRGAHNVLGERFACFRGASGNEDRCVHREAAGAGGARAQALEDAPDGTAAVVPSGTPGPGWRGRQRGTLAERRLCQDPSIACRGQALQ